jgi:calcineurin-like phosphoesterase
MIQELIFRQFGIRLSIVSVGNLLGKLGMSPQRPLYRAYEQDPEKVAEWKEKIFPRIQARAKREGAAIFFADEASVRLVLSTHGRYVRRMHNLRICRAVAGRREICARRGRQS